MFMYRGDSGAEKSVCITGEQNLHPASFTFFRCAPIANNFSDEWDVKEKKDEAKTGGGGFRVKDQTLPKSHGINQCLRQCEDHD